MLIHQSEFIEDLMEITFSDKQVIQFSLFWLRDHSTDSQSINPSTLQRDLDTFSLPACPKIKYKKILNGGKKLHIHWLHDDIISEFEADFLVSDLISV